MPESMIGLYKIQPFFPARTVSLGQAVIEEGFNRSGLWVGLGNETHESGADIANAYTVKISIVYM